MRPPATGPDEAPGATIDDLLGPEPDDLGQRIDDALGEHRAEAADDIPPALRDDPEIARLLE